MKVRTFDNLKFKKIRYLEIGLIILFSILAVTIFTVHNLSKDNTLNLILSMFCSGIVMGISIQTFTETLYIKKKEGEKI